MPGVLPLDPDLPDEEIAARQLKLLEAGVMGEPNGRPESSPEIQRLYFDIISRVARIEAAGGEPITVQWRFDDAEPWHLRIANGSSSAAPGLAREPDVTIGASWRDWIGISLKGEDPRTALLRRRIRPRGSLRNLRRLQRIFPPRPNRLG